MSDDGKFGHDGSELARHLSLVVDEGLPGARRTGVAGKVGVGEEAEFTDIVAASLGERRFGFTLVT